MNLDGKRLSVALLLLFASVAAPLVAGEASTLEKGELQLQMESQGWSLVAPGVFERRLGETRIERQGYGPEGYASALNDLTRQLEQLLKEYELAPGPKLAETIESLTAAIAELRIELSNQIRKFRLEHEALALEGPSCTNCFTATADAYPISTSQGVGAVAEANWNSSCGYTGATYAYTYARAFQGTTMTEVTRQDSKPSGSSITSRVQAEASGGSGSSSCFSQASATVSSSTFGIVYSTSDSNSQCPASPPSCSISGTSYVVLNPYYGCQSETWYASASGGTPPYTYSWGGTAYYDTICPNYSGSYQYPIYLTVTDSAGRQCHTSHWVWVEDSNPCYPYYC